MNHDCCGSDHDHGHHHHHDEDVTIHGPEAFEGMRKAGLVAAQTLDYIADYVKPGITTDALDTLCHDFMRANGAVPATLGYKGYTKSSCISINHVVCHGIPGPKKIADGDMMNIDVTAIVDGWFGDTSRMFATPKAPLKAKLLMDATYEAMMRGINVVRPGATLGDVGHAIQSYAESKRYSVVRDFCGHGIGRIFHMEPSVLHFGKPGKGLVLQEGMFFTIEPMINAGRFEVSVLSDGWTAVTKDRSLSAQFEHTIAVTKDGFEIFTLSPTALHQPYHKETFARPLIFLK